MTKRKNPAFACGALGVSRAYDGVMGMDDPVAVFEAHRGMLVGLAYRMLGSVADAEDVVQTAYVRWHGVDHAAVGNPGGYLRTVVTRLCLDQLEAAKGRREEYVGPWLPEPVVDRSLPGTLEGEEDLSVALMLALERLSPLERGAFLLHDVFGVGFGEVAGALGRSEEACRQLASRGREHVRGSRPRKFKVGVEERRRVAEAFMAAARTGDVGGLTRVLAEGVELHTDGGGKVKAAVNVIRGREKILRFVEAQWPVLARFGVREATVNGGVGYVLVDPEGRVQTLAFEFDEGGRIVGMYSVSNPEKLRGVQ